MDKVISILLYLLLSNFQIVWSLSEADARHLLLRIGFEPTSKEIQSLAELNQKQAVAKYLGGYSAPVTSYPKWHDEIENKKVKNLSKEEKKLLQKERRERVLEMKSWWFQEMIHSKNPLQEKMTLFWHNHFTSSSQKVKEPYLMLKQNKLLRKHALGSFADLLREIIKDPAMILYLDNQTNKKGNANENFARELLELFTLGIGNYTESDIKEAARAFTGFQVNRKTGEFVLRYNLHDHEKKSFMGVSGHRLLGDDIVEILLKNPKTAEWVSRKILKEWISFEINENRILYFSNLFFNSNYQISQLLESILLSDEFWSNENRNSLIKSPVELIVGLFRSNPMEITLLEEYKPLVQASRVMGQDLFDPPTVKGWEGGNTWITTHTYLARRQSLNRFIKHSQDMKMKSMGNTQLMGSKMKQKLRKEMNLVRNSILKEEYQLK